MTEVISWALYSMRAILNHSDVRNKVLVLYLQSQIKQEFIRLGPTFEGEYNLADLKRYILSIVGVPGKYLFTAANLPDRGSETHYQTYVVNNFTSPPTVVMIDPARKSTGKGIYEPHISVQFVQPLFESRGYLVGWLKTTNACQTKVEDVFCQSWSLYLQIQAVINPLSKIRIPRSQLDKYAILLEFYKYLLRLDRSACEKLREEYREAIMTHPHLVKKVPKRQHEELRAEYLSFDPCRVIMEMTPDDMFATD